MNLIPESTVQPMELVMVDPSALIIDVNVRTRVDLDKAFTDSIRDRGILQPPVGWRDEDGTVHIEVGQRRTLAAVEVGLDQMPVIIKPKTAAEQDRLIDQLAENDRREALTDSEHVAAFEQLSLFGMPIDEIAKRTGAKRAVVRQAVKLAKDSPRTIQAMQESDLTLDQAASIVDFEDDEALHQALAETAQRGPSEFSAAVKRADAERALAAELTKIREGVAASKEWMEPALAAEDEQLVMLTSWDLPRNEETGESLGVDAAKRLGILVVSAQKKQSWNSTVGAYVDRWERCEFVRDPGAHGYQVTQSGKGALSDAEKQARREKRERRAAWKIATEVRHEWIRDVLLQRDKLPADALLWVVKALLHQSDAYHDGQNAYSGAYREFAELALGLEPDTTYKRQRAPFIDLATKSKTDSTLRVGLAAAIGCMESVISNPKHHAFGEDTAPSAYLKQLSEWGYSLTEAERALLALGKKKS